MLIIVGWDSYSFNIQHSKITKLPGVQQGHMQVGFQNQPPVAQPMNLAQQIGGPQPMANMLFARDHVPERHEEAYR